MKILLFKVKNKNKLCIATFCEMFTLIFISKIFQLFTTC